jgi:peptidoglycan/LPS O-acetylase OafA/YrhL
MGNRQIVGLDLIRFAAACLVMLFHIAFLGDHALTPAAWFGWVGVQIFFVLSGVVIANSAEHASATTFLRGRILRLYPAAWICATISLLIVGASAGAYLRSLALWPFDPWVNGVYWTLGVEMVFYAIIFMLLWRGWFSRLSGVLAALSVISTVYWALRIIGVRYPAVANVMEPIKDSRVAQLLLVEHGALFAAGGLIWLCMARRATLFRLVFLAISLLTGAMQIYATAYGRAQALHQHAWVPMVVWLVAVALIAGSFKVTIPQSRLVRWIGLTTYPLYLLHDDVGNAALKISGNLPLALAAAVGAAALVTLVFEPPVKRLLALALDRAGLVRPERDVAAPKREPDISERPRPVVVLDPDPADQPS